MQPMNRHPEGLVQPAKKQRLSDDPPHSSAVESGGGNFTVTTLSSVPTSLGGNPLPAAHPGQVPAVAHPPPAQPAPPAPSAAFGGAQASHPTASTDMAPLDQAGSKSVKPEESSMDEKAKVVLEMIKPSLGPYLVVPAGFEHSQVDILLKSLKGGVPSQVSWALNVLSLLAYDMRNPLKVSNVPELLESLEVVIARSPTCAATSPPPDPASPAGGAWARGEAAAGQWAGWGRLRVEARGEQAGYVVGGGGGFWEERREEVFCREEDVPEAPCLDSQAVCASNILRNLSFDPDNQKVLGRSLWVVARCVEGVWRDGAEPADPELGENALDVLLNILPALDVDQAAHAAQAGPHKAPVAPLALIAQLFAALLGVLRCQVAEHQRLASTAIGRLVVAGGATAAVVGRTLLAHTDLVEEAAAQLVLLLRTSPHLEVQTAVLGALFRLVTSNKSIEQHLVTLVANARAIPALVNLLSAPTSPPHICQQISTILSIIAVNKKEALLAYEPALAELATTKSSSGVPTTVAPLAAQCLAAIACGNRYC